ncbi:MAG: DUF1003 domain-containing protein [Saprospiraceae bacterium]|nr:DUF1003 domain-containing protein [Saprospiraceae bacterium]
MSKQQHKAYISGILQTEDEQICRLHDLVQEAIKEEKLIVEKLLHPPQDAITAGQRISDKVARFGGSWTFILTFLGILGVWILFNILSPSTHFDPFPFILLNLVLSCVAALQAPVIMMSQNRQEEKDRERAANDYMINLKAELEIRNLHQKMDLLLEERLHKLVEMQVLQLQLLDGLNTKMKKQGHVLATATGQPQPVAEADDLKIDFDQLRSDLGEVPDK